MKKQVTAKRAAMIIAVAVIVVLIVVRLKANHDKIEKSKVQTSDISTTVTVNVAEVKEERSAKVLDLVGTLSSYSEVVVAAKTQGQIVRLDVELGQHKKKGSILGQIDNRYKRLALETAKNSYEKQKKNLERYRNLSVTGAASQQQIDDAANSFNSAKVDLDKAYAELEDAAIASPIDGYVVEKSLESGSYVNIGTAVARIADISRLRIKMNVSEANVYSLKMNEPVEVTTDVYPNIKFNGKITYVSTQGDATHSYPVEVVIANNPAHLLKSGTFVSVRIASRSSVAALSIPREALQGSIQDARVYVLKGNRAFVQKITIEGSDNNRLFVSSGLKLGDRVVVSGQINLTDGRDVKILQSR